MRDTFISFLVSKHSSADLPLELNILSKNPLFLISFLDFSVLFGIFFFKYSVIGAACCILRCNHILGRKRLKEFFRQNNVNIILSCQVNAQFHLWTCTKLHILCCWCLFSFEMWGDVAFPIIFWFLFRGKCQCDLIKLTFLRQILAVNFSQKKITHMCWSSWTLAWIRPALILLANC